MDNLVWVLVLCSIIFVLSYDPKSGMIEKFKNMAPTQDKGKCCGASDYRANNPDQCESSYYQSLQFASDTVACPAKSNNEWKGAIF